MCDYLLKYLLVHNIELSVNPLHLINTLYGWNADSLKYTRVCPKVSGLAAWRKNCK